MELNGLQPLVQALGWALVHFIWQGAAIGILFAAGKLLLRRGRPQSRYLLGLACMLLLLLAPIVTFLTLFQVGLSSVPLPGPAVAVAVAPLPPAGIDFAGWIERALPWVVLTWLAGVLLMSGRVSLNWYRLYRCLRVGVSDLDSDWQARVDQLRRFFGIRRQVQVLESALVQVPTVFGWLKPVVLLPTSSLVGLTPAQLELVIAHELGHIQRFDYVINLLQVSVETLLFYHPVVAWISRDVRREREQCCDDLVVKTCGNRLEYAKALTNLESIRVIGDLSPALAATGGLLRQRIERIVCTHGRPRDPMLGNSGVLLLIAAAIILGGRMTDPMAAFEAKRNLLADTLVSELFSNDGLELFAPLDEARISTLSLAPAEKPAVPPAPETRAASLPPAAAEPVAPETERPSRNETAPRDTSPPRVAEPSPSAATGEPALAKVPDATIMAKQPSAMLDEPAMQLASLTKQADFSAPVQSAPVALVRVSPDYPVRARIAGQRGFVVLEFSVRSNGRVTDVEVNDSWPRRVFDRAAIKAIRDWRFDPETLDMAETRLTQRFDFNIAQGSLLPNGKHGCLPVTGTRICRPESPTSLLSQEAHVDSTSH